LGEGEGGAGFHFPERLAVFVNNDNGRDPDELVDAETFFGNGSAG
jgi:hypothetical protein